MAPRGVAKCHVPAEGAREEELPGSVRCHRAAVDAGAGAALRHCPLRAFRRGTTLARCGEG
eukprot:7833008-Pyramimonas_sp.AAC.1